MAKHTKADFSSIAPNGFHLTLRNGDGIKIKNTIYRDSAGRCYICRHGMKGILNVTTKPMGSKGAVYLDAKVDHYTNDWSANS